MKRFKIFYRKGKKIKAKVVEMDLIYINKKKILEKAGMGFKSSGIRIEICG
jgi:hypothetical protein